MATETKTNNTTNMTDDQLLHDLFKRKDIDINVFKQELANQVNKQKPKPKPPPKKKSTATRVKIEISENNYTLTHEEVPEDVEQKIKAANVAANDVKRLREKLNACGNDDGYKSV